MKFLRLKYGNCLIWARCMYWRYGGYIAFRRSQFSPFVKHRLWSPNLKDWWSYSPKHPLRGWRALLCTPLFRGEVRKGDE